VAEGDTIHRAAARLAEGLEGERIKSAEAPNPRCHTAEVDPWRSPARSQTPS
jgi:hypothetical protein